MKELTNRIMVTECGKIFRKPYSFVKTNGVVMSFGEMEYKTSTDKSGYKTFINQGVNYKVHRVVATLFLDNPNNLPDVNHKNGDKSDNRVENLEWVSKSDNVKHAYDTLNRSRRIKLTDSEIVEIYKLRNEVGLPLKVIAERFGVSSQTVSNISKGNRYIFKHCEWYSKKDFENVSPGYSYSNTSNTAVSDVYDEGELG